MVLEILPYQKKKSKFLPKETEAEKNALCKKMVYNVILKNTLDSAHFERIYYFSNFSKEPLYEVVVGIVTNSEEEFPNLKIKVFDEANKEFDISQILASTPYSKKIIIKLNKPIFPRRREPFFKDCL